MAEPRIVILLYLDDGDPPIVCTTVEEAAFLADVWRAAHGDLVAVERLQQRVRHADRGTGAPP
jgi:hypothetical protein